MMPQFEVLGSLVVDIHGMLAKMYFVALPVAVLLAVVIGYFKSGGADHVDTLKRTFVATILLVSFPEISSWIVSICDGIALKIDDMSGLETFMRMVQEKSESYSIGKNVLLLQFNDLFIAVISFLSFLIVYGAKYLIVAMYYFYWVFLSVLSPILIIFYIFPSTSHITKNLFRSLIEVASWKIAWAVLSAMLSTLSLGNIYATEGSYVTLIILNFIVAVAMLLTPLLVKAIVGEGASAATTAIGGTAVAAIVRMPVRLGQAQRAASSAVNTAKSARATFNNYHDQKFVQNLQKNITKEVRK